MQSAFEILQLSISYLMMCACTKGGRAHKAASDYKSSFMTNCQYSILVLIAFKRTVVDLYHGNET
jgi:hypothetical protein